MYQVEASKALLKPRLWARRSSRLRVPRNVVMLGMVSLLTDISSEMVATVLPLYLVFTLGASPLALGAIDGTYRGAAALVQVASGFSSDRWRRHKEVAGLGYGLSALGKVALVAAGNTIGGIGAIVAFDRVGKGIRTAPRDALISLSSAKDSLATSFGVHRAMDSVGAMLGPLVAFGILLVAPARFDAVFVVSTLFACSASRSCPHRRRASRGGRRARDAPRRAARAAGLVRDRRFSLCCWPPPVLSMASVSDALIYVGLQRKIDFEPAVFPLLYVVTAVVFMGLAIPVGQLADRVGRVPVLLAGHALLFVVYGVLLMTSLGYGVLILCLVALGGYFAATEGVMTALAGAVLPEKLQASGIGILITVVSLGRLLSSLAFGALWLAIGLQSAVLVFAAALVAGDGRRRAAAGPGAAGRAAWIAAAGKILAALVALCVVGGGAYVAVAALGPDQTTTDARPRPRRSSAGTDLMVRAVDPDNPRLNGRVFEVDGGKVQRRSGDLACERVYFAAGRGICMGVAPSGVDYTATIFDSKLRPLRDDRPDRPALAGPGLRATAATAR